MKRSAQLAAPVRIDKYEVEEAARTLIRAKEISSNKRLYSAAKKELQRQANAALAALKGGKK